MFLYKAQAVIRSLSDHKYIKRLFISIKFLKSPFGIDLVLVFLKKASLKREIELPNQTRSKIKSFIWKIFSKFLFVLNRLISTEKMTTYDVLNSDPVRIWNILELFAVEMQLIFFLILIEFKNKI